jgi:DNA polymerase-3 subunit epsilon
LGRGTIADYTVGVIDTLKMAQSARPGQRNNLDVLCSVFGIDTSKRTLHGAHIDAELLSHVYLALTRGQESLDIATVDMASLPPMPDVSSLRVLYATEEELQSHESTLAAIDKESKGKLVWKLPEAQA